MAWRSGSFSRSLLSTARASIRQTAPAPIPRARPPSVAVPRIQSRRLSFVTSRNLGELGCTQSLLPLYSVMAATCLTSHLSVNVRAFCELSNEMEKMADAQGLLAVQKPEMMLHCDPDS